MKKKIDTKNLINKINQRTRERVSSSNTISFADFKRNRSQKDQPCVLLIEDDETTRLALCRILETEQYKVIAAADGTELSRALGDQFVDLIILDIGLPWINGYELAELMKEDQNLKEIPLLFISGRGEKEDIKKGFSVGANDYITKPFQIDEIKKTVRTVLSLSE